MSDFVELFKSQLDISFLGLRGTAERRLSRFPKIEQDKLYQELRRGVGILDDEDHLDMYLHSFGKMHKEKMNSALSFLPQTVDLTSDEIEVFDWGCGQGTATLCLLDYISEKKIQHKIKRITLVEPSAPALKRACDIIRCYPVAQSIEIRAVNKEFDALSDADVNLYYTRALHIFSNILDVTAFDLGKFVNLFQRVAKGDNYFICVGPYYCNSQRVQNFVYAVDPDSVIASFQKNKGSWIKEWSISLDIFTKRFSVVESPDAIRQRIREAKKQKQFYAGYILECVNNHIKGSAQRDKYLALLKNLCCFDVRSNVPFDLPEKPDSKFVVLNNILSRGIPTLAPISLENLFSDRMDLSEAPDADTVSLHYANKNALDDELLLESMHIIDPRFSIDNYSGDYIESSFEEAFIQDYLKGDDRQYLCQVFEPQRNLSSLVRIPDQQFTCNQRVDFAIELPYATTEERKSGFIVEIDGKQYHSNIFNKINDKRRDNLTYRNQYNTYRLQGFSCDNWLHSLFQEKGFNDYLSVLKKNYSKSIEGQWRDYLEIALMPIAVARIEKILLEALIQGHLKVEANEWKIAIVERDVCCASFAIEHLKKSYENLCILDGSEFHWPELKLDVVCSDEFQNSKLRNDYNNRLRFTKYDLAIDFSMLLRDKIDALPFAIDSMVYYIVRSSHYKKNERTIYSAESLSYLPLVEKDERGNFIYDAYPNMVSALEFFLNDIFRKSSFRNPQLPILSHILANRTTIGLLPTGGGKSLTYQVSAMLQPGVTLVVDPLISLMVDQYRGLQEILIDASACVNSTMDAQAKNESLNCLQNGNLIFMFLSPERFMMENFREALTTMSEKNNVFFSYGVIDEVHCVSEWGHDFRSSYLHLGRNMITYMKTKKGKANEQEKLPVIGLTATASFDVLADVERELTLGNKLTLDSEAIVRPENDERPELTYKIVEVEAGLDVYRNEALVLNVDNEWDLKDKVSGAKKQAISMLLEKIPSEIMELNNSNYECSTNLQDESEFYESDKNSEYQNAGIIFCPHAKGCFGVNDSVNPRTTIPGVSSFLYDNAKVKVGTFVGGDRPTEDMKTFGENRQNLMVATKAFGMGVDKPNVRYTINFNHPSSIESYVQEAGRGGRDRKNAISYLLYEQTEYINFTIDKINDIRYILRNSFDPVWLWNYQDRYVLKEDLVDFCINNGCSEVQAKALYQVCLDNNFFQNVDKDIQLWFHNNSFKGLDKEKRILFELTDNILNPKPQIINIIQTRLRDELENNDIKLRLNIRNNALTVVSNENSDDQYGYLRLDNLNPSYHFIAFDISVCRAILERLVAILQEYPDHSAKYLSRFVEDGNQEERLGIYQALNGVKNNDYTYIYVTWENSYSVDFETFASEIEREINVIISKKQWRSPGDVRQLGLRNIGDFNDLLSAISRNSGDKQWLINHGDTELFKGLRSILYKRRDKSDTDKAIYRLCCIGLVDDVLVDYLSETYQLKIIKRTDEEYIGYMRKFFLKYYSVEQTEKKIEELKNHEGRNILDKCLGYLAEFVYDSLERKRFRAIDDMRLACNEGITKGEGWLKEFIHLYFNSKYARDDYKVGEDDYSLKTDTKGNRGDFDVVKKYVSVLSIDSSGSEVDNAKHLYGATLLVLRAHPDNSALNLLRTYCIVFLGIGKNETLQQDALSSYVDGFVYLMKNHSDLDIDPIIDEFNSMLMKIARGDEFVIEEIINKGKDIILLNKHCNWLDEFSSNYCG